MDSPNFPALRFYAEQQLRDAFPDDTNFQEAVRHVVNNYLSIVHQAGSHAADFITELPYAKEEGGFMDAFIGVYLLTQTRSALIELLAEDGSMREMIKTPDATTPDFDEQVRRESIAFDHEHHSENNDEFARQAKEYDEGRPTKGDIADSAADGGSRARLDAHVEAGQDRTHSSAEIRLYAADAQRGVHPEQVQSEPTQPISPNVSETIGVPDSSTIPLREIITDPAVHLFGERPERITVKAMDYSRNTPNEAFRGSTKWLADHIIQVAAGSKKPDSFPRIAPLISLDIPMKYAISVRELKAIVTDIRTSVSRLRPPHEDTSGGGLRTLLDGIDPKDPKSLLDGLRKFTDMLTKKDPNQPSYADSAREDGGWKEGDGDSWNTGGSESD